MKYRHEVQPNCCGLDQTPELRWKFCQIQQTLNNQNFQSQVAAKIFRTYNLNFLLAYFSGLKPTPGSYLIKHPIKLDT